MGDSKRTYTKKELGGYLVGMFGQNMIYNIIASGLVAYYLQSVLFIPAFAIGVIVAVARVWDAINDPMMGTIVDKTKTKWGKCRPYLIIFPAIIGIVTILCFINGNYTTASPTGKVLIVAWAAISYIAWGMCFTVCDIPLWGITSLMTEVEEDRSKILGLARVAAGVGGIGVLIVPIAQAASGLFANKYDANTASKYGFILTVVVLTVISTLLFEVAGLTTRERVESSEKHYTLKENFQIMFKCKPFRQILISGILRSPLQLLMLIAISFVTYYFADNDFTNLFKDGLQVTKIVGVAIIALGIFLGQFIAMIVTPSLCKKYENKTLYNFYSIAGAVPFTLLFVFFKLAGGDITPIGWVIVIGICFFFASASFGGINVLQSVMIADCVDYEEYHHGIRPDGVFFSGQSFITKLSGGIAALIQSVVYTIVGFTDVNVEKTNELLASGETTFINVENGKYATAMFFLITIPPAIGMLLSAIPTLKYAMTDKEHANMLEVLVQRRAQSKADGEDVTDEENENNDNVDSNAQALEDNIDEIVNEINNL